jgi:hypothetical protein
MNNYFDRSFHRIITVEETWIYEYDPESKMESMQWVKKGEKAPRKFKRQRGKPNSWLQFFGMLKEFC